MTLTEAGQWAGPVVQVAVLLAGVVLIYGKRSNQEAGDSQRLLALESAVRKTSDNAIRQEMKIANMESLDNKFDQLREEFVEFRADTKSQMAGMQATLETLTRQMEGMARGIGRLAAGEDRISITRIGDPK